MTDNSRVTIDFSLEEISYIRNCLLSSLEMASDVRIGDMDLYDMLAYVHDKPIIDDLISRFANYLDSQEDDSEMFL